MISQKNIINLAVLKTIILYPNLNEIKSVKKLHIIYSFSILFSFILTPVLSNVILRSFFAKNNFKLNKLNSKSIKGSKLLLSELSLDFLTATLTYGILLILIIYKAKLLPYVVLIIMIISIIISSIISKVFLVEYSSYKIPSSINQNKYLSFFLMSLLKIFKILSRDVIFIFLIISFTQNYINPNDLKIDLIFKQAIMFNSSNYVQFLPANLIVPEFLCKEFNCLLIDYIWLRISLIFSTTLLTIYFYRKKIISF